MKPATRLAGTHRLESRMREIRPSGSEGGVALRAIPTPMTRSGWVGAVSGYALGMTSALPALDTGALKGIVLISV